MNSLSVSYSWRELQQVDLDHLDWAGDQIHVDAMRDVLHTSWVGGAQAVVAELSTGVLVAHGVVDFRGDLIVPGRPAKAAWIWNLCVRESWRGLGLGTELLATLERRAADTGFGQVALAVEQRNQRARTLYLRCGYKVVGLIDELDVYTGVIEPNTLMVRSLASGR